jgi:hypothetical protein
MDEAGFDTGLRRTPVPGGGRRAAVLATLALAGLALAFAAVDVAFAGEAAGATEVAIAAAPEPGVIEPDLPAALPRWSTASEFSDGNYKWSLSRGGLDLGLGFDTPGRVRSVPTTPLDSTGPFVQTLPTVSLGLRSVEVAPGGSWLRQLAGAEAGSSLTHRIGIEWKPAESQLMFVREGLGMRLSGDDRLTMRLRKGTLGIYMKRQF